MAKAAAVHFSCAECGYSTGRWLGRCPGCGSFGTLTEEAPPAANGNGEAKPLLRLADVEVEDAERIPTGVAELDRVLGGGLVPASLVLVGHVTKDGSVAGPRVLEHLVDCVLQFEGDRYHAHRVLRAAKNRFGSTNELGVFEMTGTGLQGVPDPSAVFGQSDGEVGAAVACALEGTRPLLLEIQALVSQTDLAMPRRVGTGVDPKRLAMIVAVLSRHAGISLGQADVFVNVAGGVRIDEPGADLAVALAIASAAKGAPLKASTASFGEVGLTGRLRPATQAERRAQECAKLGLATVIVPKGTEARAKVALVEAETLRRAVSAALGKVESVAA
jgi:DNA repair protein RadA/Sms